MTRVVLASDKFKGTMTAAEVAEHLSAGILDVRPDVQVTVVPVSDGGDGLLEAAARCGFETVAVIASGPTGQPVETSYARRGPEAAIEMAEVCGLLRLPGGELAPATASSRGLGEVVAAALDAGCTSLLLGVGGSASTDGGAGLVSALGAAVRDRAGAQVPDGGAALEQAVVLDLTGLHPGLASATVTVACDVDNPLVGPTGAAAVYGPQKGADERMVERLGAALAHWADLVDRVTGEDLRRRPGAGAAGGVGFGAMAVLGARLRPGTDVVQELTGLAEAVAGSDLVVTGEGSLDAQTLHGKAPAGVADAARRAGVPVVAVAGRCLLDAATLAGAGIGATYSLVAEATYDAEPFEAPGSLLRQIGRRLAAEHLPRAVPMHPSPGA
jgi:glycerate 2-kinase